LDNGRFVANEQNTDTGVIESVWRGVDYLIYQYFQKITFEELVHKKHKLENIMMFEI